MSNTKIGAGKKAETASEASEAIEGEVLAPNEGTLARVDNNPVSLRKIHRNELILGSGIHGLPITPCYMDIAYAVSPWNTTELDFSDGSFVLDKEVEIYKAGKDPLTVIFLTHSRYYAEWRTGAGGGGALRKYDTLEQAKEAKEILPSPDRSGPMPTVGPAYDINMFVRKPEGVTSDKFAFKLGQHWYAYVKLSLVKGLAKDADRKLLQMSAWEAGCRDVDAGEGQCNRYLIDLGLIRSKDKGKTYTNLLMQYHTKDKVPEPVPSDAIKSVLSLMASIGEGGADTDSSSAED